MKEKIARISADGVDYPLLIDLNVIAWAQQTYGSIDAWQDLIIPSDDARETDMKALIETMREAINEGIEYENELSGGDRKFVSIRQVGRILSAYGIEKATQKLMNATIESVKSDDETDSKNN